MQSGGIQHAPGHRTSALALCLGLLAATSLACHGAEPAALCRRAVNREFISTFERPPGGWVAGFRTVADWKGERGFSQRSQQTKETGRGWFNIGGNNPYQAIRAPLGRDYAVCESQFNADHTQLTGLDARPAVKTGETFDSVSGSFDLTVAFQDDGTERTKGVLNAFFQIFERSKEHGWRPAYALFFKNEQLRIGAWDDNPPVPGVRLLRGQWYRIRFDAELKHGGACTILSVWPMDADGRQGAPQVSALVIDHRKGLMLPGLARQFPVMSGSYTWQVPGREPYSAATLICAYGQNPKSTADRLRKPQQP